MKGGMTGPAVVAGNSEQSLLVRRLLGLDDEDGCRRTAIRCLPPTLH